MTRLGLQCRITALIIAVVIVGLMLISSYKKKLLYGGVWKGTASSRQCKNLTEKNMATVTST